jgi:hypothetical protein
MTAVIVVFAHLGHWYVGGPIYASPVIAVWLWLKWTERRHRRREAAAGEQRPEGAAPDDA